MNVGALELVEALDGARQDLVDGHLDGLELAGLHEVVGEAARGDVVVAHDDRGRTGCTVVGAAAVIVTGEEVHDHAAHHEERDAEQDEQV